MDHLLNRIIIIFILFTSIKPDGIGEIFPFIEIIVYFYGSMIGFVFAFIMFLINAVQRKNVSRPVVYIFIFIMFMIFNTIAHDGPLSACINMWMRSVAMLSLFEACRSRLSELLQHFETVLIVLVLLNLYCIIKYPAGMYIMEGTNYTQCWLLGYKSSFQYYFFPLLMIATLFFHYKRETVKFLVVAAAIHLETILAWNVMFLVVLIVYDCFLLSGFIHRTKIINIKVYSAIIVALNVVFIFFFTALYNIPIINFLFNNVLKKQTTLFIRFDMWIRGLEYIGRQILFGYGYTTGAEMKNWFGISQVHLHNQILMLLLQVGLIGTIIFLIFVFSSIKKLDEYREMYASKIVSLTLFCLFASVIVEIFMTSLFSLIWPVFFIGFYVNDLDAALKNSPKYVPYRNYKKVKITFGERR